MAIAVEVKVTNPTLVLTYAEAFSVCILVSRSDISALIFSTLSLSQH
jgi:hypothetical protein